MIILIIPLVGVIAGLLALSAGDGRVLPVLCFGAFGLMVLGMSVAAGNRESVEHWRASPTYQQINPRPHSVPEIERDGRIIAYRYFWVMDGEYYSVGAGIVGDNPITRRNRGHYLNGYNISDRVPTLNNESGIYAAKTPNSPILQDYKDDDHVLARVELSGRVIEGEYGYRAQRCRILEVLG
jgi:hypothetical protein